MNLRDSSPGRTAPPRPDGLLAERLFDRLDLHAERRPEALAVEGAGRALTYAGLATLSRSVAALLARRGVRRGDRVAVLGSKSPELVAAMYGVLRAGAAYVPLGADWPAERIDRILRDVAPAGLIADPDFQASLPAELPPLLWSIGERIAAAGDAPAPLPRGEEREVSAGDLAYILYTSGSTGGPKGVMHSHASALAFVRWAAQELSLDGDDRLASHAPFHFDLSTFDLFAACRAGAAVVLPDEGENAIPGRFIDWLEERRITTVYSVPSLWTAALASPRLRGGTHPALRRIIYAGEPMAPRYVHALMRAFPRAEVYNFYGPTETNVCTAYRVPPLDPERLPAAIPIGTACSGDVVSLDDGELVVRGQSLLVGYWGEPARAPEEPYRTGDLARFDEELGGYVFLGRRDGMRKVRGFRVELEEIDACLLRSAAVSDAAAAVDRSDPDRARVVAFVVPAEGAARDGTALRRHCALSLPPYMVPRVIFCDAVPRTTTGKIDRAALERSLGSPPRQR